MQYDYEGVTEVRHDKDRARLTLVAKGKTVVVEGITRIYYKAAPWTDVERGIVYLHNGRVSINGPEAVAGD